MPTQQEVEYWRNRFQRFNKERFLAANALALITHTITQPFDLAKIRAQMLHEGKPFMGLGFKRGYYFTHIMGEIHGQGGGFKKFYTSIDGFLLRTVAYTTARIWGFCYFYDWMNPDPRRTARIDMMVGAGLIGGAIAGFITNPIDCVFSRMQVDDIYPAHYRRNYSSFTDGFIKTWQEGALMRGAVPNALKVGALCASMTSLYDVCKETSYWMLGPHYLNRMWSTLMAAIVGTVVSMPFDTIKVRLQTMRPLPNGEMPYHGLCDALYKIIRYEGNFNQSSNLIVFFPGGTAYFLRLFLTCYVSILALDVYHDTRFVSEFWAPARYTAPTGIDFDVHDPFTMAFHKGLVSYHNEGSSYSRAFNPDGKTKIKNA